MVHIIADNIIMPVIIKTDAIPFISRVSIIITIPAINKAFPANLLLNSHVWSFSILQTVRNPKIEFFFALGTKFAIIIIKIPKGILVEV